MKGAKMKRMEQKHTLGEHVHPPGRREGSSVCFLSANHLCFLFVLSCFLILGAQWYR